MKKSSIIALVLILLLPPLLHMTFHRKKTLYIYTWSNSIQKDVLDQFEKKYDCRIIVDTYDTNEAMYTKIKFGAGGYDIVFPSNYFLDLMEKQQMLLPLDFQKLKNSTYIDWEFLQTLQLQKTTYGIPFLACFTGIAYRTDRVKTSPHSWNVFSAQSYAGRMTMLNDMRETIGAGLLSLGYSANSQNPQEIAQAGEKVLSWKKNLAKLESEQYKNGLASGEYFVVQGYSGDCLQLAQESSDISFFYPEEGSLATVDYAAILPSSKQLDLAYLFLDFLLTPEIAAENTQFTKFRSPNKEAKQYLPEALQKSYLLYPEENSSIHLDCIRPVGSSQKIYVSEWDRIKYSS